MRYLGLHRFPPTNHPVPNTFARDCERNVCSPVALLFRAQPAPGRFQRRRCGDVSAAEADAPQRSESHAGPLLCASCVRRRAAGDCPHGSCCFPLAEPSELPSAPSSISESHVAQANMIFCDPRSIDVLTVLMIIGRGGSQTWQSRMGSCVPGGLAPLVAGMALSPPRTKMRREDRLLRMSRT